MNLNQAIAISAHTKDTPIAGVQKKIAGLGVTVEHPKGTIRKLHNDAGEVVYKVHMHADYGFINKTKGRDGDEVDCFLGPLQNAAEVYVVHMKDMGPDPGEREDEDKCFIGFPSADAAKMAFLLHYPPTFYDGMTSLPLPVFRKKLAEAQLPHRKKKITAGVKSKVGYERGGVSADTCPRCGSKDIGFMPTDFETAKCSKCGKLFEAENPPTP